MTIDNTVSRRDFLKYLGKGAIAGACYPTYAALDTLCGTTADASAEAAIPPTGTLNSKQTPDWLLQQYMNQPVELTLKGTDVTYVNDNNYKKEVFGSNKPVMVLFYNNNAKGSQGLAALTRAIEDMYSEQIKLCAYKISDRNQNTQSEFNALAAKYPIKKTPALLFYDNDNGKVEYFDDISAMGGIVTFKFLKNELSFYNSDIPKSILD